MIESIILRKNDIQNRQCATVYKNYVKIHINPRIKCKKKLKIINVFNKKILLVVNDL